MRFLLVFFIFISSAVALAQEAAFDAANSVTAEEEYKADNYIHQGKADADYAELCSSQPDKYKDICTNDSTAFSGGIEKTLEAMLPAVTKVYSMISMFAGSDFTATVKDKEGNVQYTKGDSTASADQAVGENGQLNEGYQEKTESKKDYCGYMTIAVETVGAAYMAMQNDKTEANYTSTKPEARQAAAFYSLADTHKSMGTASKNQGYMWGGISGCYAAMLATQSISGDWKIYAKLAGSVLITAFHLKKASAHKQRASMLNDMAEKLPQAGDCNPYTDTTCFCNEETSQQTDAANFSRFCIPQAIAQRTTDSEAFICVDKDNKVDESCSCAQTSTCLDKVLKMGAIDFGLPPTLMKNPISGFSNVSGNLGSSDLDSVTQANLALAKKALSNFNPDTLPKLTDEQIAIAKKFNELGLPKAASVYLAKTKSGNGALPASLSSMSAGSISPLSKTNNALSSKTNKATKKFSSGGGTQSSSTYKKSSPFSKYKKTKSNSGVDIQDFAQRAQREAEIIQDKSKGIFEVISYRYKASAWKRFPQEFSEQQPSDQAQK